MTLSEAVKKEGIRHGSEGKKKRVGGKPSKLSPSPTDSLRGKQCENSKSKGGAKGSSEGSNQGGWPRKGEKRKQNKMRQKLPRWFVSQKDQL